MKITRENYEVYFIDYIDGTLAANLVGELHTFLANNPDLKEELDSLDASILHVQDEIFDFKNELKKSELPITSEELNILLAKEMEGDLTPEEITLLDNLSQKFTAINSMRKHFKATKISAENISFDYKHLLRFEDEIDLNDNTTLLVASLEGDLNEAQAKAFNEKIDSNEYLKQEKELLKKTKLNAPQVVLESKSKLLIPTSPDMSVPENLLVAKVEGDLTFKENEMLSALLAKDEELNKQLQLLYKTKLAPSKVVFEHKDSLRKKEVAVIPIRKILVAITSAAAIVVFMFWFGLNDTVVPSQLATVSERNATINNSKTHKDFSTKENPSNKTSIDAQIENSFPLNIQPQHKNKIIHTIDSKNDVAVIDSNFKRMTAPSLLETRTLEDIANNKLPGLKPTQVDMMQIHTQTNEAALVAQTNATNGTTAPATIWQLLGDAAEKRIEKTAAYALVERQTEKLKPQKNKFNYERTNDELKLRVGNFEFKKDVSARRVKEGPNLFQRIAEKIESIR